MAESGSETTEAVLEWSRGRGADAVLVCAASSSSDLVARTPALARDRAPVVIVGDVGVRLERTPFYEKELSLRFARSYGPGRYERAYEEWGIDYPPGQVRWTEGRNLEAVLDLLASRRLGVADLITHRFPVERAPEAWRRDDAVDHHDVVVQGFPQDEPLVVATDHGYRRCRADTAPRRGDRPVRTGAAAASGYGFHDGIATDTVG